jgi:hypothetical protein
VFRWGPAHESPSEPCPTSMKLGWQSQCAKWLPVSQTSTSKINESATLVPAVSSSTMEPGKTGAYSMLCGIVSSVRTI